LLSNGKAREIRLIRKPEHLILTLLTEPSRLEVSLAKIPALPPHFAGTRVFQ
jgi:hypothetical protein